LAQPPPPSTLPIKQITLFTSGVAYTERDGSVDGNATVPLIFHTAQINDILKSMVLIDRGGKVQPATFASSDPVGRTLQGFAIDVSQDMSQSDLLGKLRGANVSVETAGGPTLTGQMIGVEDRPIGGPDVKPVTATYLNVLTESGLTSVPLDQDKTVRILDDRLNHELHEALSTLATGTDTQRRQVTLHFAGLGRRDVRVAYVTEAPIWKISYRLVLGGSSGSRAAAKPYLQGWAIVENTTDEDWKGVRLSLVSGRPVSFIQDLYQPLYIPRPEIGPDVVASPYPQTHDENLQVSNRKAAGNQLAEQGRSQGGKDASGFADPSIAKKLLPTGIDPNDLTALSNNNISIVRYRDEPEGEAAFNELRKSSRAQASGRRAGEMFAYNISSPVTLLSRQAAMIPVIAQDITADRVSIYNADLDGQFPMNAVRLRNTTNLHLKGGPITLFDGGAYAGDARMEDVPPGDSRLISYAVDLSMICSRNTPGDVTTKTSISVRRGLFTESRSIQDEVVYTLKSRSDKPKTVLVEHPIVAGYSLNVPTASTERTASVYRFRVTVPPHKTQTLRVVTEHKISSTVALSNMATDSMLVYASNGSVSAKLKNAFQEIVHRRKQIDDLKSQSAVLSADIAAINDDQDRIRKNMGALDKASSLYKRYVSVLDGQETKMDSMRHEVTSLKHQAAAAENALRAFMDTISE
jgi:hypothetical protein